MQANARSDGSEERGEDSESVHQNMDAPFLITHHTFTVLSSTFFSTHASTSWLVCLRNQSRSSSGMQNFFHILSAWLFPPVHRPNVDFWSHMTRKVCRGTVLGGSRLPCLQDCHCSWASGCHVFRLRSSPPTAWEKAVQRESCHSLLPSSWWVTVLTARLTGAGYKVPCG